MWGETSQARGGGGQHHCESEKKRGSPSLWVWGETSQALGVSITVGVGRNVSSSGDVASL